MPGRGPICGRDATERMSEYIRFMRARVRLNHRQAQDQTRDHRQSAARGRRLVSDPAALKSKTESQIKQGIGRIWNEMEKAGKAKDKVEPEEEAGDEG